MDKTLAALYAVDTIGRRLSSSYRSISNQQGATAEGKSKRVKVLNPVFTLGLAITKIKETLLKKAK